VNLRLQDPSNLHDMLIRHRNKVQNAQRLILKGTGTARNVPVFVANMGLSIGTFTPVFCIILFPYTSSTDDRSSDRNKCKP
jgi:hypothetical protein